MVFASFVPLISVTGFVFFALRHIVDSYNLLTVNRKEIDSSCKMFQKILLISQLGILMLQACMTSYMYVNGYYSCAGLMSMVFLISLLIIVVTNRPLLDLTEQGAFNDLEQLANQEA